jgi:hypothetical protein
MAGSKTAYLGGRMLDYEYGLATPSVPGTVYLALHTGPPGPDGTANECASVNGYVRKSVTNSSVTWQRSGNVITSKIDIAFSTPTGGDWGLVTHVSVWDASTGGNCRATAQLASPIQTYSNVPLKIPAGFFSHTEA